MGAIGSYSITQNWGAEPTIEWPQWLESDDHVVSFIKDLRKFGVGTTSKMDGTTGRMRITAGTQVGIYQKSLIYEPVDFKFMAEDDPKLLEPVQVKPPKSVWTLVSTHDVDYPKPSKNGWHPAGAYYHELHQQEPISAQEWVEEDDDGESHAVLASKLSRHIPDIRKSVKGPCGCKQYQVGQIWYLIQHLNDYHHPDRKPNGKPIKDIWTRERIADWLDEVDADLAFDPDLPAKREARRKAAEAERQRQREALIKDLQPTPEQMVQITAELSKATTVAAGPLKSSLVKLNVAMDEFSKTIHEMVQEIGWSTAPLQGCECHVCKAKANLYPEKFPDQEES